MLMKKELYLYSPLYDFIVQDLIAQIDDNMDNEVLLRVNCSGGQVFASYGLFKKIKEHGKVDIKVDGSAMSAAAFLLLYGRDVSAMDVSRIIFHRADMMVDDEADQKFLDDINKDLKAQFKMKIDADVFKEITSTSINDLFNPETRIDVTLNGSEAKKIGLIKSVDKLTPAAQKEITAMNKYYSLAAHNDNNNQKSNKMTAEEIKAKYPEAYASIIKRGIKREQARVEACLVFIDIDAKGVKEAIASGQKLSQKQISEFSLKAVNANVLEKIAGENAPDVKTKE